MTLPFIADGWSASVKRPGLAGLLFAGNLILGIILAIPILMAFSQAVSSTGFSPELSKEFDIALWADLMQESGPVFQTMLAQLFWILPVLYIWKVSSAVGIVHALSGNRDGSFWTGLGKHAGPALLLGIPYVVMAGLVILGTLILNALISVVLSGEVLLFWLRFVATPVLLILALAVLDMMHDFARLELVIRKRGVWNSFLAGIRWFFRSGTGQAIYMIWFVIGLVALFLPFWADLAFGGLFLAFVFQQVLLYVRSLVTVGWLGSEVFFFQEVVPPEPEVPQEQRTVETN
jgi:hypothetical protein